MKLEQIIIPLISLLGGYVAAVFKTRDTKLSTDKDITLKTYEILESRMKDMEAKNEKLYSIIEDLKTQISVMQKENFTKEVANQQALDVISKKLDKAINLLREHQIPVREDILP